MVNMRTQPALCDLHIHVGSSVAPHIMWSIAHQQGLRLPVKDYWEFVDMITINDNNVKSLDDYIRILHEWTERIQSSPAAIERSVYEIIGKEFRSSRVKQIEVRFNPMKRNLDGERDLDHIIHAAIRGLDRASLEYGVKAGLIFCMAREFEPELNEIVVEKAIKYHHRGVVGIDVAGSESRTIELSDKLPFYVDLFERAKAAGLGTTIHTGETKHTSCKGMDAVLTHLKPHRIGHGVQCHFSEDTMKRLVDTDTVLEICPTSNLHTRAVNSLEDFRGIFEKLDRHGVRYTINTDGTYYCKTNLRREFSILTDAGILTQERADQVRQEAFNASFLE
jgi:adenosine deaminase